MKIHFQQWTGAIALGALIMGLASTAAAVDPGIGVGAPGPGVPGSSCRLDTPMPLA